MTTAAASTERCLACGAEMQPAMARCRDCGCVRGGSAHGTNRPHGRHKQLSKDSESDVNLGAFDLDAMLSTSEIALHDSPTTLAVPGKSATKASSTSRVNSPPAAESAAGPHAPAPESPSPSAGTAATEPPDANRVSSACTQCGRAISAPRSLAGKRVKCPTCGTPVVVPGGPDGGRPAAEAVVYRRDEVRARLEAAVKSALALPAGHGRPAGDSRPVLSRRELRKLEAALARAAGDRNTTAVLDAAGVAITRLAASADPRAGEPLLRHLQPLPPLIRAQAIRALGELQTASAFEPLLRMLAENDDSLMPAVLAALGNLGDPRAVPVLVEIAALTPEQRVRAVEAIVAIGTPALARLQRVLQPDVEASLKLVALDAAGRIGDAKAIPLLTRFTNDADPDVRRQAVEALAHLEAPGALRALAAALADASAPVRSAAAAGLARVPDRRLVPFLMRAIQDSDRDVKQLVIRALGLCGDESAVAALRPLVTCGDGDLELEAAEAVARLGDHAAVPSLLEKLEFAARLNGDEPQALKLVDALRRLKDDRAVLPLIDLLAHRSERLRSRAAEALGQIGDRTAVGPIADLFDRERSPLVMASAARALGDLKDPAGVTALQAALQQTDAVRIKAVIALGEIGGTDALELAAGRLADTSAQVRYQAATVLGRSGKNEFAAQIAPLIDDADDMVRRAALKALAELGDDRPEAEVRQSLGRNRRAIGKRSAPAARTLHDLVPSHLLGLMSPRLAAIGTGALALFAVSAALAFWRPFSTSESSNLPRGRVKSLGLADGGTLVAGRTLRLVELWDVEGGKLRQSLPTIMGDQVAMDAGGSRLLCGDSSRSALYDLKSGQALAEESGIKALAVNLRLTRAATQSTDGRIIIWNLESGQIDARLQFDRPDTTALAVAADGRHCAVGTRSGEVFVTDIAEGAVVRELRTPDRRAVQSLAFNPGRTRIAIGTSTGEILLCETAGTDAPERLGQPGGPVAFVMFLDDVRVMSVRGESLEVWDTAGASVQTVPVPLATINGVGVSPDGRRVAVGSTEETPILVYDLSSLEQVAELDVK